MATRLSKLKAYRDVVEEAYYSGYLTVTFDGNTTTFQKAVELRTVLSDVERKIAGLEGKQTRPRVAAIDLGGF